MRLFFTCAILLLYGNNTVQATFSNHLESIGALRNQFAALRHGQSVANVARRIASHPELAARNYGLSHLGITQAQQAGMDVVRLAVSLPGVTQVVLLSSDLKRARETAEQVAQVLRQHNIPMYQNDVIIQTRLRERWFGEWDMTSDENYQRVWDDDVVDSAHTNHGVESVDSVMDRTTQCILEWDAKIESKSLIVCVSHGDCLQILQTAFLKQPGTAHRSLEHLETAKLRKLELATDTTTTTTSTTTTE